MFVRRLPGDGHAVGLGAGADSAAGQAHQRLGRIDFNPNLRTVPGPRRPFLEADAAGGHQRDAVSALFSHFENVRRSSLRPHGTFIPLAAVTRVPKVDGRDSRGSDVLDFVIDNDALAVDDARRSFPCLGIAAARDFSSPAPFTPRPPPDRTFY